MNKWIQTYNWVELRIESKVWKKHWLVSFQCEMTGSVCHVPNFYSFIERGPVQNISSCRRSVCVQLGRTWGYIVYAQSTQFMRKSTVGVLGKLIKHFATDKGICVGLSLMRSDWRCEEATDLSLRALAFHDGVGLRTPLELENFFTVLSERVHTRVLVQRPNLYAHAVVC